MDLTTGLKGRGIFELKVGLFCFSDTRGVWQYFGCTNLSGVKARISKMGLGAGLQLLVQACTQSREKLSVAPMASATILSVYPRLRALFLYRNPSGRMRFLSDAILVIKAGVFAIEDRLERGELGPRLLLSSRLRFV